MILSCIHEVNRFWATPAPMLRAGPISGEGPPLTPRPVDPEPPRGTPADFPPPRGSPAPTPATGREAPVGRAGSPAPSSSSPSLRLAPRRAAAGPALAPARPPRSGQGSDDAPRPV